MYDENIWRLFSNLLVEKTGVISQCEGYSLALLRPFGSVSNLLDQIRNPRVESAWVNCEQSSVNTGLNCGYTSPILAILER
jgi:hypothetical protein